MEGLISHADGLQAKSSESCSCRDSFKGMFCCGSKKKGTGKQSLIDEHEEQGVQQALQEKVHNKFVEVG
jgi:hypothetical protein